MNNEGDGTLRDIGRHNKKEIPLTGVTAKCNLIALCLSTHLQTLSFSLSC